MIDPNVKAILVNIFGGIMRFCCLFVFEGERKELIVFELKSKHTTQSNVINPIFLSSPPL